MGSSFRGACLLRLGGGGSGEEVIEARVWEITDNIWLSFYLCFLIKWPLVRGGWGREAGGLQSSKGDTGERLDEHIAHCW